MPTPWRRYCASAAPLSAVTSVSPDVHRAGGGRQQAGQAREQRRLARAAGPEQQHEVAVAGLEPEALDRPDGVAALRVLDRQVLDPQLRHGSAREGQGGVDADRAAQRGEAGHDADDHGDEREREVDAALDHHGHRERGRQDLRQPAARAGRPGARPARPGRQGSAPACATTRRPP